MIGCALEIIVRRLLYGTFSGTASFLSRPCIYGPMPLGAAANMMLFEKGGMIPMMVGGGLFQVTGMLSASSSCL